MRRFACEIASIQGGSRIGGLAGPVLLAFALSACGGTKPAGAKAATSEEAPAQAASEGAGEGAPAGEGDEAADGEVVELADAKGVKEAHGATASKIKATKTEAALKFVVVDKDKGPIPGIVIALTGKKDQKKVFTAETDAEGYTEILVPIGQDYDLVYLSLGMQEIAATIPVTSEPNQNIRLTLRYKRILPPAPDRGIVLDNVHFDTGKATIRPESLPELDRVAEYLTHKPKLKIEIAGHTDNVGDPKSNQSLSQRRADACRAYLIKKGIDQGRVRAVGYGDTRPISPNDTVDGRQRNRRIEAQELSD
jgi:outer membrane protein OmpA-like peptidoglycan-associated protein